MYKPESPDKYNKPQIILNSGRLLLNAKEDSVLIFANKSIALSSAGTLNFDADNEFIVNASEIHLGLPDGDTKEEKILKGETHIDELIKLVNQIQSLAVSLSTMVGAQPGVPFASVNAQAGILNNKCNKFKNDIKKSLSKQNYTI